MANLKYWLWLSALQGVRGVTKLALLDQFDNPEAIYFAEEEALALVEMKHRFFVGDALETVTPSGSEKLIVEDIVIDATGEHVGVVSVPQQLVRIPCGNKLSAGDMLRGPVRNRK